MFFKTHKHAPNHIIVTEISDKAQSEKGWISRHDFTSFEQAEEVADAASCFAGADYIATDAGDHRSPRYDVINAPKVLDPVSYSFNGDSYPCGYIKTISKTMKKITTTDGHTFYRYKQTGIWMRKCWYMVGGHIEERNPHF